MHHPKTRMQNLFLFDPMQWDMQKTFMIHYFQMEWKESMFDTKRHKARNKIQQKCTQKRSTSTQRIQMSKCFQHKFKQEPKWCKRERQWLLKILKKEQQGSIFKVGLR